MKISCNWLKDYLQIEWSADQIAKRLTDIGLEVEGVSEWVSHPGALDGIFIGQVKEVEPHPNADKLRLTKVDVGQDELLPIVCGAPNVAEGQKVVVALVDAMLYPNAGDPFKIKKAKIRGEVSIGMICAEDEIGVGESHDGIMVLPQETEVGTAAADYFNIQRDHILEIGLTANRADANSHIGTAFDLAAAISVDRQETVELSLPDLSAFKVDNEDLVFDIDVQNHEACTRYVGLSLTDVKIAESPDWLKNKLESLEIKSINNVVDITNYVLHEYGQPLHAFDADKIEGKKIIVAPGPLGETFKTLDEVDRKLFAEDLMIRDEKKGLCMAGVYGGLGSGVTDQTRNIFLESARFDPIWIRRSATRHKLRTDAAAHFEKGTDPNVCVDAIKRAAMLMQELAGAKVSSNIIDVYPEPVQPWEVGLRWAKLDNLIGEILDRDLVRHILKSLGFVISEENEDGLVLQVPTAKNDVLREADLIEEVLRVYGMDKIGMPKHLKSNIVHPPNTQPEKKRTEVGSYLNGMGYREIFTNPISKSTYVEKYWSDQLNGLVRLENSLNAELDSMRPSLLFGALEVARYNINRRQEELNLFEFGRVFESSEDGFKEQEKLALLIHGKRESENWIRPEENSSFFDLKAQVIQILERSGLQVQGEEALEHPLYQYGLQLKARGKVVAQLGLIQSQICSDFDIKASLWYAEIDAGMMDKAATSKIRYQPISRFPSMRRDLALVLDQDKAYSQVEAIARKQAGKVLENILLFDRYEGSKLGDNKKSYGLGLYFRGDNKTLTDKQVDKIMDKLIRSYEQEMSAIIRR
jgi:phenylalanyl-tRNA synthetase beta chain